MRKEREKIKTEIKDEKKEGTYFNISRIISDLKISILLIKKLINAAQKLRADYSNMTQKSGRTGGNFTETIRKNLVNFLNYLIKENKKNICIIIKNMEKYKYAS